MKKSLCLVGLLSVFTGCVTTQQADIGLPEYVTTVTPNPNNPKQSYVDKVNKIIQVNSDSSFNSVKLCAIETFSSQDVSLSDAAGSFVGRSGKYYNLESSITIPENVNVKYIDESSKTLIMQGVSSLVIKNNQVSFVPVSVYVRYDAKIILNNDQVILTFQNIKRAFKNTGSLSNHGFTQVGTWFGGQSTEIVAELDKLAEQYNQCINST